MRRLRQLGQPAAVSFCYCSGDKAANRIKMISHWNFAVFTFDDKAAVPAFDGSGGAAAVKNKLPVLC